ncbi:MAG: response regulator [Myxococcaceae bacterium]|nr:response regulator [Myxococcaceae bacterium]
MLLASVTIFLIWSVTRAEWPLAGMLALLVPVVGGLTMAARRGSHRFAGYGFSLLAIGAVVGGATLRGNPGYASFYMVVGVVLAAVTLEVRDVVVVAALGLLGEAVVASFAPADTRLDTLGGVYAEGTLLYVLTALMAVAMTVSLNQLLADLFRRDAEAHAADERAARLAEQLEHSQRMEALGRLAGGVAHDFNNLLTVMQSCASLVESELPASSPARTDSKDLQEAISRASELTKQLLAFSRRDVVKSSIVEVREVTSAVAVLLQRLLGSGVSLRVTLCDDPCPVLASPAQLEQVLMNLAVNARDAMSGKGELTITLERPAGTRECRLMVRDTGVGMTDDVRARAFEPFFTTKPAGKGTGLGLATVYGITTRLGGRIAVDSAPGKGTTFLIDLPLSEQPTAAQPHPLAPQVRTPGDTVVVLVDDEVSLRHTFTRVLDQAGYQTRSFGSADEALADRELPAPDVLVTDVHLAGQSGITLAEALLSRHPGLRVIIISGFTAEPATLTPLLERGAVFLAKPFAPAALLAAVRGDSVDADRPATSDTRP